MSMRKKTGGRKAGTPNKVTGTLRDFVSNLIDNNREQIERDLKALSPKDRLLIIEKFMQYTLPKRQAISAGLAIEGLTDDQIGAVADAMLKEMEL